MASMASLLIRISALLIAFLAVCCPASLAAPPLGKRYRVGGPEGWRVPPPVDKEMFYVKWASPITFFVEDSIEFVYKNDTVIKVSKAGYYHCNETVGVGTGPVPKDGSTLFLLDAPGFAYFASADLGHCADGQRLMINVLAAEPPAPASSLAPAQAPTVAPSPPQPSASSFPPGPGPAPSMEYSSAAGTSFLPSFACAVLSAAVMVLAGFV
ncbi:early nodulin-like protein 17 [Lolium perenne]|uniref:early nodulin-like protein 17 n=1 Tax=Lolium perenne TaxID=4522 RepID=UPI0021EA0FA7|nr:uclacyanin-3-like [Lolium perenne]